MDSKSSGATAPYMASLVMLPSAMDQLLGDFRERRSGRIAPARAGVKGKRERAQPSADAGTPGSEALAVQGHAAGREQAVVAVGPAAPEPHAAGIGRHLDAAPVVGAVLGFAAAPDGVCLDPEPLGGPAGHPGHDAALPQRIGGAEP